MSNSSDLINQNLRTALDAPSQDLRRALGVVRRLTEAGYEAFLVGGCVRDIALGKAPKDFDITTAASPEAVAHVFPGSQIVGAHFGVALVQHEGQTYEVATYRYAWNLTEDGKLVSTLPSYRDIQSDLRRRDFTINAMLIDSEGRLVDPVGGIADLMNHSLRTTDRPEYIFRDDPLRMLRAIRFSCVLNMSIHPATLSGIQQWSFRIAEASTERVAAELSRILTSGRADQGIELMETTGLLHHILPEVEMLIGCQQNPKYHPEGDVYVHTLGLLRQLPAGCSVTLALAALLHDTGKPETLAYKDGQPTFHGHEEQSARIAEEVLRRLKYSNEVIETVVSHCAQHMRFRVTGEMRRSKLMRFLRQSNFPELLALHRLDAGAGRGNFTNAEFCEKMLAELPPEVLHPVRLVTGADLIALGLKPGPKFREVLEAVESAQLEGQVHSREDALIVLKRLASGEPVPA